MWFTDDKVMTYWIVAGCAFVAIIIVWGLVANDDRCVPLSPPSIVYGYITHPYGGLLSSDGSSQFFLRHQGTKGDTDQECLVDIEVTENEYEKHMYSR